MALITGSPAGTMTSAEDLFPDSAPTLWFQDSDATPWYNPDSDGFYWNLTGSATYPIKEIGCLTDVALADGRTLNDVLCDNVGVKSTVQQRNYVEFTMTVQTVFPLQILTNILNGGTVTETAPTQKFGFGPIDNTQYWHVYGVRVYDETAPDYVWFYFHKCQFVNAWTINMAFGQPWQIGVTLRAFADTTYPTAQVFGSMGRLDASVVV